jgi:hypothetical protein
VLSTVGQVRAVVDRVVVELVQEEGETLVVGTLGLEPVPTLGDLDGGTSEFSDPDHRVHDVGHPIAEDGTASWYFISAGTVPQADLGPDALTLLLAQLPSGERPPEQAGIEVFALRHVWEGEGDVRHVSWPYAVMWPCGSRHALRPRSAIDRPATIHRCSAMRR